MSELDTLNYVNVGPGGTFCDSGDLVSAPADIDALFAHLEAAGTARMAIHFHGGLVKEAKGAEVARMMIPVYRAAGAHPVCFIWESGAIETITRNLRDIHETRLFQKLLRYVFRQITKRLGADISGRGPGAAMTVDEIEAELAGHQFDSFDAAARGGAARLTDAQMSGLEGAMRAEIQLAMQTDTEFTDPDSDLLWDPHLDPAVRAEISGGGGRGVSVVVVARKAAAIAFRVIRRFVKGRDHGVSPTVVEEIVREFYMADFGGWVWSGMKSAARQMWLPNDGTVTKKSHAGTYFLERLAAHKSAHPDFQIDLIGHSAGSIAICEMFRAGAAAGTLPHFRTLIFLAPACRSDLMEAEIVDHPQRFDRFRMYTMADAYESKDQLVPRVYNRSLLYAVSGVFEPDEVDMPIAGMERFWTGKPPFGDGAAARLAAWLKAPGTDRLVLSVTAQDALDGFRSSATKHGDFDNDLGTQASLRFEIGKD